MAAEISNATVQQATERGRQLLAHTPVAVAASFNPRTHRIVVDLDNGCEFAFPPELAQGLSDGTHKQWSQIEVSPTGLGLHWPQLDADLYVPSLIQGIFGSNEWMRKIGSTGGSRTTESKRAAAQRNGKLGGRPPKKRQTEPA